MPDHDENSPGDTPTLIVGHARNSADDETLATALELAGQLRAHVHVVHVGDLAEYPVDPDRSD